MQISVFCHHYESNNDILKLLENFLPRRDPVSLPVNPKPMAQVRKQNKLPEGNRKQIDFPSPKKAAVSRHSLLITSSF